MAKDGGTNGEDEISSFYKAYLLLSPYIRAFNLPSRD
jgi:hypothetical protein